VQTRLFTGTVLEAHYNCTAGTVEAAPPRADAPQQQKRERAPTLGETASGCLGETPPRIGSQTLRDHHNAPSTRRRASILRR